MKACRTIGVEDVSRVQFNEDRRNGKSQGIAMVDVSSEKSWKLLEEKLPQIELDDCHTKATVTTVKRGGGNAGHSGPMPGRPMHRMGGDGPPRPFKQHMAPPPHAMHPMGLPPGFWPPGLPPPGMGPPTWEHMGHFDMGRHPMDMRAMWQAPMMPPHMGMEEAFRMPHDPSWRGGGHGQPPSGHRMERDERPRGDRDRGDREERDRGRDEKDRHRDERREGSGREREGERDKDKKDRKHRRRHRHRSGSHDSGSGDSRDGDAKKRSRSASRDARPG